MGRRLHVAILDEELPFPPTSGKRIRTWNLVRRLAPRHRITYVAHRNADPDEARSAAEELRRLGITVVTVERTVPPKSGVGFYARLAGNLLSPQPYSVATHRSRPFQQAVRRLAAEQPVDLWHCEWTPYATNLDGLLRIDPSARWLVMAHNVESLIWQRYAETETNPLKRWYVHRQWLKFERFERRVYSAATRTVAVSDTDAALVRERFGAGRVEVVENGVDTAFFQPPLVPSWRFVSPRVLFLGSLDWRPNLDAVDQLLGTIFPAVRAEIADARLSIVGRNPPAWLRERVSAMPGAELHANVADVRPFLAQSSVLAVPLRIGGGSRLKILEALATRLPVVSSRVGAEGLALVPDRHLIVTDDAEGMAPALVAALRDPRTHLLAEQGRHVVLERYDWAPLADRLERVWFDCAAGATAREERAA
jgi:glycosyltransferase involved in cell wall biosynthesis